MFGGGGTVGLVQVEHQLNMNLGMHDQEAEMRMVTMEEHNQDTKIPCVVLTSDRKPRLRWTAELHNGFIQAVAQLGGPDSIEATPKAIMRLMGVNGLTLFHLKSHLQKYRLAKQSGKDFCEVTKDGCSGSDLLDNLGATTSSTSSTSNRGYEAKEALRALTEVQPKLHLQVEVENHWQLRKDSEGRYLDYMLDKACKLLAREQTRGCWPDLENLQDLPGFSTKLCSPEDPLSMYSWPSTGPSGAVPEANPFTMQSHNIGFSTNDSYFTSASTLSSESPVGGNINAQNMDLNTTDSFIWGVTEPILQNVDKSCDNSRGLTGGTMNFEDHEEEILMPIAMPL